MDIFANRQIFAVTKHFAADLLGARRFLRGCRIRNRRGVGVDYEEFLTRMRAMNFREFRVDGDHYYFLPTAYPDLFINVEGELVVFETEVLYHYESAEYVNDVATENEFYDALDARKSYDRENGWKSGSIGIWTEQWSRPATAEEIEKIMNGERVISSPGISDPNRLEYEWTEEERAAHETEDRAYWDREIARENALIAAWTEARARRAK